jgi:AcrR family transcriptional regulator
VAERKYQLKKRALGQAETRRRIVRATSDLHRTVGPAATTISAIADLAGVRRLTVYRHFPDDAALINACGADWMARYPLPDPAGWASIDAPQERTRTALHTLYAYYQETADMLEKVLRDAPLVPPLAEQLVAFTEYFDAVRDLLLEPWPLDDAVRGPTTAALGIALDFSTWQAISRQGLAPEAAASLMTTFVRAIATGCAATGSSLPGQGVS